MGTLSNIIDTSSIGSSLTDITNIASKYVVSPIAAFGLAGFVFDVEGEAVANLTSESTDHYTEDNTAIQDHIVTHPEKITLKGYVGELVYNNSGNGTSTLQNIAQKLTIVSAFLPTLSAAAVQAQQAITPPITFNGILSASSNIFGLVQNVLGAFGNQKNQQNAYNYFKALWKSKTLMSIQTPWEFMTDMAIDSIIAIQTEDSKFISDFAVTYKKINIAQTSTTAFSAGGTGGVLSPAGLIQQGAAALQAQAVTLLGPVQGAITSLIPSGLTALFR